MLAPELYDCQMLSGTRSCGGRQRGADCPRLPLVPTLCADANGQVQPANHCNAVDGGTSLALAAGLAAHTALAADMHGTIACHCLFILRQAGGVVSTMPILFEVMCHTSWCRLVSACMAQDAQPSKWRLMLFAGVDMSCSAGCCVCCQRTVCKWSTTQVVHSGSLHLDFKHWHVRLACPACWCTCGGLCRAKPCMLLTATGAATLAQPACAP
jgi:hypothetical protein